MKTLITALLGASMLAPLAAQAQRFEARTDVEDRGERPEPPARPEPPVQAEPLARAEAPARAAPPAPMESGFRQRSSRDDDGSRQPRGDGGADGRLRDGGFRETPRSEPAIAPRADFGDDRRGDANAPRRDSRRDDQPDPVRQTRGERSGGLGDRTGGVSAADRDGIDRGGTDRAWTDRAGRDRAGMDRAGMDRAGADRAGAERRGDGRGGPNGWRDGRPDDRRDAADDGRRGNRDGRDTRRGAPRAGSSWGVEVGGGWRSADDGRGRYDANRSGGWNRGWRNDNRYDWNRYRSTNRGLYRLPRYYAPYGWSYGYRRFSIGVTLSAILWNRNYWIDDPWAYRLPEAYGPYRWVRYYDDALLVDIRTGQVVDVVNGIFW